MNYHTCQKCQTIIDENNKGVLYLDGVIYCNPCNKKQIMLLAKASMKDNKKLLNRLAEGDTMRRNT